LVKSKAGRQYSIDTTLQIVYKKLTKAFGALEDNQKAALGIIKKCTKTAKRFYNDISQENDIDNS
jgi:hypothetical protein